MHTHNTYNNTLTCSHHTLLTPHLNTYTCILIFISHTLHNHTPSHTLPHPTFLIHSHMPLHCHCYLMCQCNVVPTTSTNQHTVHKSTTAQIIITQWLCLHIIVHWTCKLLGIHAYTHTHTTPHYCCTTHTLNTNTWLCNNPHIHNYHCNNWIHYVFVIHTQCIFTQCICHYDWTPYSNQIKHIPTHIIPYNICTVCLCTQQLNYIHTHIFPHYLVPPPPHNILCHISIMSHLTLQSHSLHIHQTNTPTLTLLWHLQHLNFNYNAHTPPTIITTLMTYTNEYTTNTSHSLTHIFNHFPNQHKHTNQANTFYLGHQSHMYHTTYLVTHYNTPHKHDVSSHPTHTPCRLTTQHLNIVHV